MLVSIFTPTYNREKLLRKVYNSLLNQTVKDFEWIIVDDGSTDNTEEVVNGFMKENKIPIIFRKQTNSGKHIAINLGVSVANGKLFFIVDSDDFLTTDAIAFIREKYTDISDNDTIGGLICRRGYSEDTVIGSKSKAEELVANAFDVRFRFKTVGDMAEVVKLSVMKQYPFPEVVGEKFCSEGLIWFRIARNYTFKWYAKVIYIGEYLEGGLSADSLKLRRESPVYTSLLYSELSKSNIPYIYRIKYNINFWRFAPYIEVSFISKWRKVNTVDSLIGYPISLMLRAFSK